jgi:hypothetical protein
MSVTEEGADHRHDADDDYLDPYRPLLRSTAAPATGSPLKRDTELAPEQEPVATGTLFLMIIFLMLLFGIWAILYAMLLER